MTTITDPASFWNARYAQGEFAYGEAPNDWLREVAGQIPAGPVLCLAEGEGRNAVFLAERGHDVLAVDLSAVGLEKAARLATSRGVSIRTQVADLAQLQIEPGAWSGIVAIWMHLPIALRARVHADAVRGLAPGGVFILEAYTPAQLALGTGGPSSVELLVEPDALRSELAGLDLEVCAARTRTIHEGAYHAGTSAVVQVLGRKR